MREILFRAKRQDNKQWVQGSLLFYPSWNRAFMSLGKFLDGSFIEVRKDTAGQYTGLTDKNGQKIFEGDIVDILTENGEIGVIAYNDGGFLVEADTFCVTFQDNINGTDVEIIGNIHDNPELLKDGASDE